MTKLEEIRKALAEATPGKWETRFANRVSVPRVPDEDYDEDFSSICKGRQIELLQNHAPALLACIEAADRLYVEHVGNYAPAPSGPPFHVPDGSALAAYREARAALEGGDR